MVGVRGKGGPARVRFPRFCQFVFLFFWFEFGGGVGGLAEAGPGRSQAGGLAEEKTKNSKNLNI